MNVPGFMAVHLTFPMRWNSYLGAIVGLLVHITATAGASGPDWLIDPSPYRARVHVRSDRPEVILENGLLKRVIRIEPNAATVSLENQVSGESLIRGVKPEAVVELNGKRFEVGGLEGNQILSLLSRVW